MDGVFPQEPPEQTRLPEASAQECRRRAEDILNHGNANGNAPRAIAWALLAVAGELHTIRMQLRKR